MKKVTVNVSMIWPAPGCCTAVQCGVLTVPSPHPAASAHTEAGRGCQLPATRRASGQLDPAAGGQPGYSCSWELQCNSWDSCSILRAGSSCCFTAGCSTTAALERILLQNIKCSILDKYDITNAGPNTTVKSRMYCSIAYCNISLFQPTISTNTHKNLPENSSGNFVNGQSILIAIASVGLYSQPLAPCLGMRWFLC